MAKATHEHTLARRLALSVLYEADVTGVPAEELAEAGVPVDDEVQAANLPAGEKLPPYALDLVRGVVAHEQEADRLIAQASENWSVERMPITDRAIMRIALYEMLHEPSVPVSVSINEAVELARAFGGEDDSSRFINGVLGKISRSAVLTNGGEVDTAAESDGASAPCADLGADQSPLGSAAGQLHAPDSPSLTSLGDAKLVLSAEPATDECDPSGEAAPSVAPEEA